MAEALANVGKHAGDEARAWILLEEEAGELLISVRDNGVGMTREQVERALSGDRLGIQDSTLGRVSEIGGVAVARSQPGRGVEWEFRIPMEDVMSERRRVMLVDDHPMWIDALSEDLEAEGFQIVAVAHDGDQCLRRARAVAPRWW